MLHLTGRIALGVDVGDLLELERALEGDGEVDAASQEQKIGGAKELAREIFVKGIVGKNAFQLAGQTEEFLDQAPRGVRVEHLAGLGQIHGQDEQAR